MSQEDVARAVRQLMLESGAKSKAEFARRCGLDPSTLSSVLDQEHEPTDGTLANIAIANGRNPDVLIRIRDEGGELPSINGDGSDRDDRLAELERAIPELRAQIEEVIRRLEER